jgi:hypothetical protein
MHGSRDLTVDGRAKPGAGVGRFCRELIKLGIREEKIAELARERFGGKTSVHCVRWYASKMRVGRLPA